jgi:hypothetical protein
VSPNVLWSLQNQCARATATEHSAGKKDVSDEIDNEDQLMGTNITIFMCRYDVGVE